VLQCTFVQGMQVCFCYGSWPAR